MRNKVLFVEDDQDDVFLIQRACKNGGLVQPTEFLPNGKAAVDRLCEVQDYDLPGIIFLDLNMPLMGGLQFLGWLRQQPGFGSIPVVVLTTSENPEDIKAANRAGANAYILKPTTPSEFTKMLTCAVQFWLDYNRSGRS